MTRSRADWYDKANSFAQAWAERFGTPPAVATVALALSVAEHETRCGDAWPGDYNWGACTKGGLSQAQRRILQVAGVHAILSPATPREASERAALGALIGGGQPPANDQAIHVDSSPAAGPYFTFFGKFHDDVEGAGYFVHVLAEQRTLCRSILEKAASFFDGGVSEIASAMYRSHYFTGFHDPHTPGGDDANIGDYARSLAGLRPGIFAALDGWSPGAEPPAVTEPATPDLGSAQGLQVALNLLGAAPALAEDGIIGPKTRAALEAFQRAHDLPADGLVGPTTLAALRLALG